VAAPLLGLLITFAGSTVLARTAGPALRCENYLASEELNSSAVQSQSQAQAQAQAQALQAIANTTDWRESLTPLLENTDPKLRQSFVVRASGGRGKSSIQLPVNPASYKDAKFVASASFRGALPEGARLITQAEFGYDLSGGFRSLGPISYAVVGKDGRVLEVGGGSSVLLRELKWHIFGRTLSAGELRRLSEVNRKIIDELRADPQAKAKVAEFAKKRGWPEGLAEQAQLAYFSETILPLDKWAAKNGYTLLELRDAGWYLLTFDNQGRPKYKTNGEDSIKIPYFADARETRIPIWRTRALRERDDGKKYIGWQLDRSVRREFTVAETLYNGWKLGSARGQTVVITEGEFKCLVAESTTGLITVGIPGITQFDRNIASGLISSGAKEFVVILDRDPVGKGLARLDEVTDSQRAAYMIARELQAAGATNVKVGRLPDAFDGAKLGIDDLILAKGTGPYLQTIAEAVTPDQYAKELKLDLTLQDLLIRRQRLRKTLENYQRSADTGGPRVSPEELQRVVEANAEVERAFRAYILQTYHAKSIAQPSYKHRSLPVADVRARLPAMRLRNGTTLPSKAAADEIIVLNDVTSEVQPADLQRSDDVARDSGFTPATENEQRQLRIAGKLAHDFPLEEYHFEFGVKVGAGASIPIVIIKKASNKVVAMAEVEGDFTRLLHLLRPQK
jgi:hypothetical protein